MAAKARKREKGERTEESELCPKVNDAKVGEIDGGAIDKGADDARRANIFRDGIVR